LTTHQQATAKPRKQATRKKAAPQLQKSSPSQRAPTTAPARPPKEQRTTRDKLQQVPKTLPINQVKALATPSTRLPTQRRSTPPAHCRRATRPCRTSARAR